MEPRIVELMRAGLVDEVQQILDDKIQTREIFRNHMSSHVHQFIGLAARHGDVDILKRCVNYGLEVKIGHSYGLHALVGAASQGHDHIIKWMLMPWIENGRLVTKQRHLSRVTLPENWLCPALHKAIRGQYVSTVKLLVQDAWADVNACDSDKLRPLHVAAGQVDKDDPEQMSRYEQIVDILLTAEARVNDFNPNTGTTPLYDAVSRNSLALTKRLLDIGADVFTRLTKKKITVVHEAAAGGFHETLRAIMEHDRFRGLDPQAFDKKDLTGRTPLYVAAERGNVECVRLLVKKGSNLASKPRREITVMEALFKRVPDPVNLLREILDEQVSMTDDEVIVDYKILKSRKYFNNLYEVPDMDVTSALMKAVRENIEQTEILQHPVLESFLHVQYRNLVFYDLLILLLHLLRVGFVSWEVMHPAPRTAKRYNYQIPVLLALVLLVAVDNGMRVKHGYLSGNLSKQRMLWLFGTFLASFVIGVCEAIAIAGSYCSSRRTTFKSYTILLSWTNVMMMLTRFPLVEKYSSMFLAVLLNVSKVFLFFACLIAGFTFSFSILFSSSGQFNTPWKAMVKTLLMMTGEYEYDSLFNSYHPDNSTIYNKCPFPTSKESYLQPTSMCIMIFLALITGITLMNLMISLSISDVHNLLKKGRGQRLVKQAESVIISYYPMRRMISRENKLNLNTLTGIHRLVFPAGVETALNELALKNLSRTKRPQTDLSCPENNHHSLAAIQTLLEKIEKRTLAINNQVQSSSEDNNNTE